MVQGDPAYQFFANKKRRRDYTLLDPEKFKMFSPMPVPEGLFAGPEWMRSKLWVCVTPITGMLTQCEYLILCSCDIQDEEGAEAALDDRGQSRLAMGVHVRRRRKCFGRALKDNNMR